MRDSSAVEGRRRLVPIGDLTIHDASFAETVAAIIEWSQHRAGRYVCTPNVDYVVQSRQNQAFRSAIENADLRVPDGMWIIYASRIAGRPLRGTVTGRLLLPAVAREAARLGLKLALFGAADGVARRVGDMLTEEYPGLSVVAAVSPPTPFAIGSAEDDEAVLTISASDPDVVFVALGAPKQELWMQQHAAELGGATLVGVGAAFDIMSGRFREAPRWMTAVGLEWLMRLAQEPKRLATRYLRDDPWILWWAVRARIAGSRR